MLDKNLVYHGDCLEIMKDIDNKSIDMILCDLPYGVKHCKWDIVIPFELLWQQYERVIKDNGAIVLTASQPFTSLLIGSNLNLYRYNWVWVKDKPTNFVMANKQPMKYHEDICVFYKQQPIFNKQMIPRSEGGKKRCKTGIDYTNRTWKINGEDINIQDKRGIVHYSEDLKNPSTILYFDTGRRQDLIHPTQKPVLLFEYFIKTYTNENGLILDNCIGSGTTALASLKNNRDFIGIEKEEKYVQIANQRIQNILQKG